MTMFWLATVAVVLTLLLVLALFVVRGLAADVAFLEGELDRTVSQLEAHRAGPVPEVPLVDAAADAVRNIPAELLDDAVDLIDRLAAADPRVLRFLSLVVRDRDELRARLAAKETS